MAHPQVEIVVIAERAEIVIRGYQRQQVEIGVQDIIVRHERAAALHERELSLHVRIAHLRDDVSRGVAVRDFGSEFGIELRLHVEHRVEFRSAVPYGKTVCRKRRSALSVESQRHLSAHVGEHIEQFVRTAQPERRKQRGRHFVAEHSEHRVEVFFARLLVPAVHDERVDVGIPVRTRSAEKRLAEIEHDTGKGFPCRVLVLLVVDDAEQIEDVDVLHLEARVGDCQSRRYVYPCGRVVRDKREQHVLRRRFRIAARAGGSLHLDHDARSGAVRRIVIHAEEEVVSAGIRHRMRGQFHPYPAAVQRNAVRNALRRLGKVFLPRNRNVGRQFVPFVTGGEQRNGKAQHQQRRDRQRYYPSLVSPHTSHLSIRKFCVFITPK